MLASFGSIRSSIPSYGNHLTLRKLKCALLLCRCKIQSAETCGGVGKQVHELVSEQKLFQDSNQLSLENCNTLSVLVQTG